MPVSNMAGRSCAITSYGNDGRFAEMTRGRLITFEGGEGAGKSTQVRQLADRLAKAGEVVVVTREPGGAPHAEQLRDVLLSGFAKRFGTEAEAVLFTAARIDHMDTTILPALAAGKTVISDRFIDSTLAYQGVLGRVSGGLIAALERTAIGDRRPDLTVLIDLDSATGLARASERRGHVAPDRFEEESLGFHARLRDAYLTIAHAEPERVFVVDGGASPDAVAATVWSEVASRFAIGRKAA